MPPKKPTSSLAAEESSQSKRLRRQTDMTREERRPLSLARILSGSSACVALAEIKGTCYIASNSLYSKSRPERNQHYDHLVRVMAYFSDLAKGVKKTEEEQIRFLIESFKPGMGSSDRGSFPKPTDERLREIIIDVIRDPHDTISGFCVKYTQGEAMVVWDFVSFYKNFRKVRESLKDEDGELVGLFRSSYEILLEDGKGVHAEMRLLSKLFELEVAERLVQASEQTGTKIELAISKLCCLHCQAVVDAVEEIFEEHGIQVEILSPGTHAIPFERNWEPPAFLSDGYHGKPLPKDSSELRKLEFRIGELAAKYAEEEKAKKPAEGWRNQDRSASSSEAGSTLLEDNERVIANLEARIGHFNAAPVKDAGVYRNIFLFELAIRITKSPSYQGSLDIIAMQNKSDLLSILLAEIGPVILKDPDDAGELMELQADIESVMLNPDLVGLQAAQEFQILFEGAQPSSDSRVGGNQASFFHPKEPEATDLSLTTELESSTHSSKPL